MMKINKALSLFSKNFSISKTLYSNKLFARNYLSKNLMKTSYNSFSSKSNENANPTQETDETTHYDFLPQPKQQITDENVMKVIDDWVKNNKVVLFMKGTKEMPRCGFSSYLVNILNFYKVRDIKVINILESTLLRDAVKKYSNWPTYPQLYVNGNLIGGCDIIKDMHENGAFKELVIREGIESQE